ncbi:phosphotransferase enzyme family protein [Legionella impletisoli]|uniref:Aminoglycoside phosphotransferase domain-containing protein n=1 Tax=Legionella impletisoli TaxID=343510 RepID=A0A917N843_9GAMM|nr:phosphotransferase [Legionella impletisoli]GGI75850.1 hypothetical protein GCM10007966_00850 [Legionella impletisoli]
MWNEVLKRINNATPKQAVDRWGGDLQTIKLISEGINLVYRFEKKGGGYYLRVTHTALRQEKALLSAICYQQHLFKNDAPVCEPVRSNNDAWIEQIKQGNNIFIAHVCKEVPGQPIHFNYENDKLYRRWGMALGKLHKAAKSYKPKVDRYTSWDKSIAELENYAKNESIKLQNLLIEVTDYFNKRIKTSDNFGLTHGDHREGNVLTDGETIHIIDFDLPSYNWFMEDFSRPFFHPIVHEQEGWQNKITLYLEGYLSIMPETSIDLSAIEKQIQMKCLEIYLWTKNNWSSDIAPGGGNTSLWLAKVYNKIMDRSWTNKLPA